jgi:hypothetical protein
LKRTSTAVGFLFYIFDLEYLIRVQSSETLYAKMNPISCLFGSRFACAQTAIFSAEPSSKNAGETPVVLWITAREYRIPTSRNPNQNRAALRQIFSSNKSVPANRKTGFYANCDPNKQEVGFIVNCMKRLRTLKYFQIFKSEIKKSKTNLVGRYL